MEQETIKKDKKIEILKYVAFTAAFALFFNAKILGLAKPLAPALLFALVWCGQNIWVLSLIYLAASCINGLALQAVLPNVFCVFTLVICALIQKKIKRQVKKPLMCFYFLLSQLGKFIFIQNPYFVLVNLAEIGIGVLLFVCFSNFFQVFLQRTMKIKLNVDEALCAGVFLISLSCGLTSLTFFQINFGLFAQLYLILLFLAVFGFSKGVIFASLVGIGSFLVTENIYLLAFPIVFGMISGIFASTNKYFIASAGLISYSALGFYFGFIPNFSIYQFTIGAFGILLFALTSKKTLKFLKKTFSYSYQESSKSFIQLSNKLQYFKLAGISKVFDEMNEIYKEMIKKNLSKEEAAYMLSKELEGRMCSDCPNRKVCFRQSGKDMLNEFYDMFTSGIAKKEIKLIDVPNKITTKCEKCKKILPTSNDLLSKYNSYVGMLDAVNFSRIFLSEQMKDISLMIKNLAEEEKEKISFNNEKEKEIYQNLIYSNITGFYQASVVEKGSETSVILTAPGEIENINLAEKVISKSMKIPFELSQTLNEEGNISYYFRKSPKCDIVFGVAGQAKNLAGPSGDCHSAIKLSPGKIMFGLCDGMGCGKQANDISEKTIRLIEAYYRAGFGSEQIISNINKILLSGDEEKFSTLDLCVLDLDRQSADFIKLGAPQTFIKKKNAMQMVDGGALPIGMVEKVSPKFETCRVDSKDLIFMVSDGVSDCFADEDALSNAIASLKGNNPQELAQKLLDIAKASSKNQVKDDMTVFVSRVYSKVQ